MFFVPSEHAPRGQCLTCFLRSHPNGKRGQTVELMCIAFERYFVCHGWGCRKKLRNNAPNFWECTFEVEKNQPKLPLGGTHKTGQRPTLYAPSSSPFCQNSCKIDRLRKSRITFRIYLDTFHTVPLRVTTWCGIWLKLLRMVLPNMRAEVYVVCVCLLHCIINHRHWAAERSSH